jgi:hypothetical protein
MGAPSLNMARSNYPELGDTSISYHNASLPEVKKALQNCYRIAIAKRTGPQLVVVTGQWYTVADKLG